MANRKAAHVGLVIWTLTILLGTHLPPGSVDLPARGMDKLLHFGAYALWGLLAGLAVPSGRKRLFAMALVGLILAALDEGSQSLVARHCELQDFLADLMGVFAGLGVARRISG